jgi:hypothetical protein
MGKDEKIRDLHHKIQSVINETYAFRREILAREEELRERFRVLHIEVLELAKEV